MALDRVPEFPNLIVEMWEDNRYRFGILPITLGGTSGSYGGQGVPPGGFTGNLIQRRVAFDTTEEETLTITSGSPSLLDNLNRIRYRIRQMELGGVTSGSAAQGAVVFGAPNQTLTYDRDNFLFDDTNNTLYIGFNSHPIAAGSNEKLVLLRDGGSVFGRMFAYGDFSAYPQFGAHKARGSRTSGSSVNVGDTLFSLFGQGYTGSGWVTGSRIDIVADENFSSSSGPARIALFSTPSGSTTPIERMRLLGNGRLGIGLSTPESQVEVFSTSSGSSGGLIVTQQSADGVGPHMILRKKRNITAFQVQSGDELGVLDFAGFDIGDYDIAAAMYGRANQTWSETSHGARLEFYTVPDSTVAMVERMRLLAGGGLTLDAVTNGALRMKTITLADTATAQLPLVSGNGTGTIGWAIVIDSTGAQALYALTGSANATIESLDPNGVYSAASGTGSSTNIYWSGANSRYEIENRRGSSVTYTVLFFVTA